MIHRDDHRPEDLRVVDHQARAGRDVQRDQRAEQDRRGARAGNAQRQQRHEGAGAGGVVGGLGCGEALDRALAELLLLLLRGDVALHRVAEERAMVAPAPGMTPMKKPWMRLAADDRRDRAGLLAGDAQILDLAVVAACGLVRVQHQEQRLGQGEHRHGQRDEAEARLQIHDPHGEARHVEQRAFADGRQHQAEHRHHQRLGDLAGAGEGRDGRQAHHHQREVLGRMEQQRDRRQRRREDHQQDRADGAARKAGDGGDGQRLARLALARHRIAVESSTATVPATPGALIRIDEVEPPKIAP